MIITPNGHALGRVRDTFDPRDHQFVRAAARVNVPVSVDPRGDHPLPIKDQGQLGACTGFGTTRAFRRLRQKLGLSDFDASELFAYYNGRSYEHTIKQDSGCQIRDVVKQQAKLGYAPETLDPYNINNFKKKPKPAVFVAAALMKLAGYQRVDNTSWDAVRTAIAQNGNLVIGIEVYESFESDAVANTGVVPMPSANEQELGGHCMDGDGYTANEYLLVANSWSDQWGDKGYCVIPRAYITNPKLCSDCWTLVS